MKEELDTAYAYSAPPSMRAVVGVEGFRIRVERFSALDPGFLRTYAVFALGVSALLAYALVPKSRAA